MKQKDYISFYSPLEKIKEEIFFFLVLFFPLVGLPTRWEKDFKKKSVRKQCQTFPLMPNSYKTFFSSLYILSIFSFIKWQTIKLYSFFSFSFFFSHFIFFCRMWMKWNVKFHTNKGCSTANTITSASEGFNPLPKSTDFWAKLSFNPLRTPKHDLESKGKLSAKVIHFITYNHNLSF